MQRCASSYKKASCILERSWSIVFLAITTFAGYLPGNKLPYAEHFNFSIQREVTPNKLLTLAYVGTGGHKLFAQYEANPGDPPCASACGPSGVKAGTVHCGPNQENTTFMSPDGSKVIGTSYPAVPTSVGPPVVLAYLRQTHSVRRATRVAAEEV
jgi:hypothetical protein